MPDYDGDGYPDSFFDQAADCFWLDTSPDWGLPGDSNDPMLVLEDADGAGPERIEVHNPAPGSMTVGIHYWVRSIMVHQYQRFASTTSRHLPMKSWVTQCNMLIYGKLLQSPGLLLCLPHSQETEGLKSLQPTRHPFRVLSPQSSSLCSNAPG